MRQLQFDDIAIPHLGFLDLLMVAESRKRRAEAMSAMFSLSVDAEPAQPTTERSVGQRCIFGACEHIAPIAGDLLYASQDSDRLPRQRHDMLPAGFHLGRRNGPALSIPVDLSPFHVVDDARARDR